MNDIRRLLVVGTDYAQSNAVQDWCRSKGYIIATAMTAADALKHLAEVEDHVVLADQTLSDMTGAALIRSLHRDYPKLICVLTLDPAELASCVDVVNSGMIFRTLFKPCSPDAVQKALEDALVFHEARTSTQGVAERMQRLSFAWQSRFEEKNREVALQAKRLQISQMLFDTLPRVILGISVDGTVVEANEQARTQFDERGLIGCSIDTLLPTDARALIRKCLGGGGASTASFSVTLRGQVLQFQCISFLMSGVVQGCLLYGGVKS